MTSPFPSSTLIPGRGRIQLVHVPPNTSSLRQVTYQYPLKLVAPKHLYCQDNIAVQTVYLLTYGGGLVAGDGIDLSVDIDAHTRLVLLTQGSTKIFKSPSLNIKSTQKTAVVLQPGAALCYLPDPVQPFGESTFDQKQTYKIVAPALSGAQQLGSLCVLDWVSQGRTARGENWDMRQYTSRNDVWLCSSMSGTAKRLLLRDNLSLQPHVRHNGNDAEEQLMADYAEQMHGFGVFGTLILYGPLCESLGRYFHDEFKRIPRVGGRKWDDSNDDVDPTEIETTRIARQEAESRDGLIWTVASLRGCTIIKFGSRDVEGGKKWLRLMLEAEGSIVKRFGERALLCLT